MKGSTMSQKNVDFVIVSAPILNFYFPPAAPAVLKAVLQAAGHNCIAYDLSIKLRTDMANNLSLYNLIDHYMQLQSSIRYGENENLFTLLDRKRTDLNPQANELYTNCLKTYAKGIIDKTPTWVGTSVLSTNSIIFTYDLIKEIRNINPKQKIVIGGSGLLEQSHGQTEESIKFGDVFKQKNLVDEVIYGEGEKAIVDLANGILLTDNKQIKDLDDIPYPDYSDYVDPYFNRETRISITGSRGCIRNCAFCDIKHMWNKFVYRSARNIADELIHHYKTSGFKWFYFTDSLINGSISEFRELSKIIIEEKRLNNLPNDLSIKGQYIFRPAKSTPPLDFDLMLEAGIDELVIGVESGSPEVLHAMGKKYNREDIDYNMHHLDRVGILVRFLLIIGFPTETRKNFEETMDMLRDYKVYADRGTIACVNLSKTCAILENSPLGLHPEKWGVEFDKDGNWTTNDNDNIERAKRRLEAQNLCETLGYNIVYSNSQLNSIYESLTSRGSRV